MQADRGESLFTLMLDQMMRGMSDPKLATAGPGIVTGCMLAVARAAGETAPVLLVAGGNPAINFDPFSDNQSSLSLYVFEQAGVASQFAPARAWAAALTLVVIVLTLTVLAKLLARRNKLAR